MSTVTSPATAVAAPPWTAPSRLLIASLPAFVVFVVVAAVSFPEPFSADMDADQLAEMGALWPITGLLWAVPVWLGTAGLIMCYRHPVVAGSRPLAKVVGAMAALSAAAITVSVVLWISLTGADVERIGDTTTHQVSTIASLAAGWLAIPATGLLALVLRSAGVLGRSGIVLPVICGLYVLVDVVSWLPALTGSVELSRGGGIPPFLIAIIWCALGVVLARRRRVSSGA